MSCFSGSHEPHLPPIMYITELLICLCFLLKHSYPLGANGLMMHLVVLTYVWLIQKYAFIWFWVKYWEAVAIYLEWPVQEVVCSNDLISIQRLLSFRLDLGHHFLWPIITVSRTNILPPLPHSLCHLIVNVKVSGKILNTSRDVPRQKSPYKGFIYPMIAVSNVILIRGTKLGEGLVSGVDWQRCLMQTLMPELKHWL